MKAMKAVKSDDPLILYEPRMSGPTNEKNPRCELCAVAYDSCKKVRVHVWTTTKATWGPSMVSDMKKVMKAIASKKMSKIDALALCDKLRKHHK